ncbi:MAG: hypothetical protein S4CHLAM45_10170 [Chlamydiales bacterium]|nr:hypothetical protein [Chlamydiales bacterium]MCH9620167.1 hypothetical protein [Chlamydiales bacterium]MCH9623118.1 hypothetical protein [Chlamydiales bacterium]
MAESWEPIQKWYDDLVGTKGHYYHKHVILPKLIPLLGLSKDASLLDLGCGQGILARFIPKGVRYQGIDLSPSLIQSAQSAPLHTFTVADACKPLKIGKFSHACAMLSLQNMEHADQAIKNISKHLEPNGTFVCVLNHPCFRIPRQSHWGVDKPKKLQYRRIDRYLTPMDIPIHLRGETTMTFHHSLSDYSQWLYKSGLQIVVMEEWTSDKLSSGSASKMENRARNEFPLFLTIKSQKV